MGKKHKYICNCEEGKKAKGYSASRCVNPTVFFETDGEICMWCTYYAKLDDGDSKPTSSSAEEEDIEDYPLHLNINLGDDDYDS